MQAGRYSQERLGRVRLEADLEERGLALVLESTCNFLPVCPWCTVGTGPGRESDHYRSLPIRGSPHSKQTRLYYWEQISFSRLFP
jgi:hypothetical protein